MKSPTTDDLRRSLRALKDKSSIRLLAKRIGIAHTTLADFLDDEFPREPYGPTVEKMVAFLVREAPLDATKLGQAAESSRGGRTDGFAEHVLVTAGRIIQLAEQIAHAAEQQRTHGVDLGRRAQATGLSMPDARERDEAEAHAIRKKLSAAKKKAPRQATG